MGPEVYHGIWDLKNIMVYGTRSISWYKGPEVYHGIWDLKNIMVCGALQIIWYMGPEDMVYSGPNIYCVQRYDYLNYHFRDRSLFISGRGAMVNMETNPNIYVPPPPKTNNFCWCPL